MGAYAIAGENEERRFDSVKVSGLRPYRREQDGALLFEGVVTREGILEYRRADGSIRRELVTRQAVLDTARTMPRSVVTLEHPADGMVTSENYQAHSVGDVDGESSVEESAQGAFVRVKLAVRRRDAVDAVEAGLEELSAGYLAVMDNEAGVHPVFGAFDASQIGRRVNHCALVPAGRAGSTVALLRADSADSAASVPFNSSAFGAEPQPKEQAMKNGLILLLSTLGVERLDNEDSALADGLRSARALRADAEEAKAAAIEAAKEDPEVAKAAEDAGEELAKLKADNEALVAELEALKAKEAERADAAELADLQSIAATVKLDSKGLSASALRLALVQTRVPTASKDWASARLDGVLEVVRADAAGTSVVVAPILFGEKRADASNGGADDFYIPSLDGPSVGGDQ